MSAGEVRVAHLADSHFDESNLEANARVHGKAIEGIRDFEPDVILHAGDVHDRLGAPATPAVRNLAAEVLAELASIAPVFVARGNHDFPGDLLIYQRLRSDHPIEVREAWDSCRLISRRGLTIEVQLLPWFDKSYLAGQVENDLASSATTDELAIQAVRGYLTAFQGRNRDPRTVVLGVGHVNIGGSVVSSGQTLIGRTVELSPSDLARTSADLWALGHIHRSQSWAAGGCSVHYAGSLERLDFGEPEAKGWLAHIVNLVETDAGLEKVVESVFVELPATKIVRLEPSDEQLRAWISGEDDPGEDLAGAKVRIRWKVTPEALGELDLDLIRSKIEALGAAEVKLDPIVRAQVAVRSEALAAGAGLDDHAAVRAWVEAIGLPEADFDRLDEKIDRLEEEIAP